MDSADKSMLGMMVGFVVIMLALIAGVVYEITIEKTTKSKSWNSNTRSSNSKAGQTMATKIPDKCPECGCDVDSCDVDTGKVVYDCGSVYYSGPVDTSFYQSTACRVIISLTIDNDMWADHYAKLKEKYIETLGEILGAHSYQDKDWFCHDCTSSAEWALGELEDYGAVETHPTNNRAFRWIERTDDE